MARPDDLYLKAELPKTRSGKIMRRLLHDFAAGGALADTATLANSGLATRLRERCEGGSG